MILCAGEALIDMIPTKDGAFAPVAGGAVFNTAIGLGRQGADVALISGVSTDLFGDLLTETLQDSGVATDLLVRADRPTTLAFVKLVKGKATYAFYDENTAGRLLSITDMPRALPPAIKAVFFGGISLAVEPCADAYAALLAAVAADHVVMLDPNIRPGFIKDETRYRARIADLIALADIVKLSDEDLDWLYPGGATAQIKAQDILAKGPKLVCLTLGAEGALILQSGQDPFHVAAPAVAVEDTIGAGDAFNAGLLCALDRAGQLNKQKFHQIPASDIQSSCEFAVALASETAKTKGSNPPRAFKMP